MLSAHITFDIDNRIAPVPPRLFGTFVEHMGRSVYGGLFERGDPRSDDEGFRTDVLSLVRELGATIVRYPGGNFVSGYRWEDGIGPIADRPTRLDAAWHSLETNKIGLHEFAGWAKRAGLELMLAVNLGTRGIAEAAELLEYANVAGGTTRADERRANGAIEPFGVRVWCLGNEMDGPWQIGHKTADEYGRLAAETARMMRFIDPEVELVVAGSSSMQMPTFGEWERTVLRHTAELIDHVSVHAYYEEVEGDVESFLASAVGLDRYIDAVADLIDAVTTELGIDRTIGISVDEWNVWYQRHWNDVDKELAATGGWPTAPRLLEDEYSVTDGVVVGSLLISLLRHADRVSMASMAQLVNVIAPIRSEPGIPAWRQTTFFPFQLTARLARGSVLRPKIVSSEYESSVYGTVAVVDAVATWNPGGELVIFVVNRHADRSVAVEMDVAAPLLGLVSAETLTSPEGGDRHSTNSADSQPVGLRSLDGVTAAAGGQNGGTIITATLPALSWSVLRFGAVTTTR